MEYSNEECSYEGNWYQEEDTYQSIIGEEEDYGSTSWYEEEYSGSHYGEEPCEEELEPEPPDHSLDVTSHQGSYEDNSDQASEIGELQEDESEQEELHQEEKPWCEIPYSDHEEGCESEPEHGEFTHEEEKDSFVEPYDKDKHWYEETDSEISLQETLEEEYREGDSWQGEADSQYSLGEENHNHEPVYEVDDRYHKPWCKETNRESDLGEDRGEDAWHEETDSEISLRGGDQFDDGTESHEVELEDSLVDETELEEEDQRSSQAHINNATIDEPYNATTEDEADYEPHHICFSGHEQGPKAYQRWERDMDDWMQANNISEEEKTSYAEDTLTKEAFRHWDQDVTLRLECEAPESTWEEMKQLLHGEFVEDASGLREWNLTFYNDPEPRRWILAKKPKREPQGTTKQYLEQEVEHIVEAVDQEVSRTKPFQGGGYDEVIRSTSTGINEPDQPLLPGDKPYRENAPTTSPSSILWTFDPRINDEDIDPKETQSLEDKAPEHEAKEILLIPIGLMTDTRLKKKWLSPTTTFDPGISNGPAIHLKVMFNPLLLSDYKPLRRRSTYGSKAPWV